MSAPELEDPMKVDGIGHYERLEITQQADNKEIKKAYRSKAKELHPDKNKDDPDAGVHICFPLANRPNPRFDSHLLPLFPARKFDAVKKAYEILLDPKASHREPSSTRDFLTPWHWFFRHVSRTIRC